jgi:L-seryl-tRNA(Ser) seleniumtransferase
MSNLSGLPSVDLLLQTHLAADMVAQDGRPLTLLAIRTELDEFRKQYQNGDTLPGRDDLLRRAQTRLESWLSPNLVTVINATGVILHTNLGRAPLSHSALQAVNNLAGEYSSLEFDLAQGRRGQRTANVEKYLTRLTGAEAALVVNNNAAAVMLILSSLAHRKRVIISRTQLVEIGGGFRIPEVMAQSGARLVEIGTTNRVHLTDYEEALIEPAAIVFHAHQSNFKLVGFTSQPGLDELAKLAKSWNTILVSDLGSGAILDTAQYGLAHEPTVEETLQAGVDLVCFSGDKLFGGPQAGIILGRADLIAKLRHNPLARAVRADKMCLAALQATVLHYLKDEAVREIPTWQMIAKTPEQIQARAEHWRQTLGDGEVIAGFSTVGGGSLPSEEMPTFLLALKVDQPNRFLAKLREAHPPIIARVENEQVLLDPRTVLPEQEGALLVGLLNALGRRIQS